MNLIKLPTSIKTLLYIRPTINFLYPLVIGLKSFYAQQKINRAIWSLMQYIISDLPHLDLTTYITGSYEIKTNERDILSLSLIGLGDFRGAHPKTTVKSLTTNVKTGKVYKLKDLFKQGSDYIRVLSSIISKEIYERDIPILVEFKEIRHDQDYYIADKSLVIYFQQVEISPYSEGFPYFIIPIYNIQDIIDENGPLGKMVEIF